MDYVISENFYEYNKGWLNALGYNFDHLKNSGAMKSMNNFIKEFQSRYVLLPFPLIIPERDLDILAKVSKLLLETQTKILIYLLSKYTKEELLVFFDLPEEARGLINWSALTKNSEILGRFDIVPTSVGYQFCEINIDSSLGGLKILDSVKDFFKPLEYALPEHLSSPSEHLGNYIKEIIEKSRLETIVVFTIKKYLDEGTGTVRYFFNYLKNKYSDYEVILVHEDNYPSSLLDKNIAKKVLVFRFANFSDVNCHDLLNRIINSGATILSTFESEIRSNKKWFSMFYSNEFQHLLNDQEKEIISQYVPETIQLSEESFQQVLTHKDNYVFKKNRSYGGKSILFGKLYDEEQLKETVHPLGDWTAQKKIDSLSVMLPDANNNQLEANKIVFGLYQVCNSYSGMMIRASAISDVVNVATGNAKVGWALSLKEYDVKNFLQTLPYPE